MKIREAILTDLRSISQLAQETYIETFGKAMSKDELKNALEVRSEKYFHSIFGKDVILITEENDDLVGFIQFGKVSYKSVKANKNDIELNKIYIDKNYQGKGIGKQLMEAMLAHKRLARTKNIYLDVFTENIKAIGLYQKYEFKIIGKTPFKVNGKIIGYDLLMKKSISSNVIR